MKHIITILIIGALMAGCTGKRPTHLGITSGRLAPCPDKPNCVSSQEQKERHHIEPIQYKIGDKEAYLKFKQIINKLKRATLISEKADYLHVEFKSRLFGFVDDVEFYFPGNGIIHVRSASRLGYSDLGVNRKRIEKIRTLFHEQ